MTAIALSACGPSNDGKTVGQKVDAAIAKSEIAAGEAKVKTQSAIAQAGSSLQGVAQKVEVSGNSIAQKAQEKFEDASITAAVTAELAKDRDISVFKIHVETTKGIVLLKGTASTGTVSKRAETIAKGVKGVESVDNQIIVKGN